MSHPDQAKTIAFLSRSAAYGVTGTPVEKRETHISIIFLIVERAFKLKRAVTFSYLDFSTVELRRRNCEAELRLGRAMAPALYRAVHAVTRDAGDALSLDGAGEAVDWLIEMRRFDEVALFDRMATSGRLTSGLMRDVADEIAAFHAAAPPTPRWGTPDSVHAVIADVVANLKRVVVLPAGEVAAFADRLEVEFATHRSTIGRRNRDGRVRRCHGDLHLRNICLLDGKPTLFDPIEFNDAIASIDVLYDIAFLLMDLIHRDRHDLAAQVFNRYLDVSGDAGGLGLVPLHLGMRAAIRAHVSVAAGGADDAALGYFRLAQTLSRPVKPMLIAVGGVSGTGKTTLAQAIAPRVGRAPGARVLRSDVIRKRLHGVAPERRLPTSAYDASTNIRVYHMLGREAATALGDGQAVIADAAFLRADERAAIAAIANNAGVPFVGLWLDAPEAVLAQRLSARRGDASDADVGVLRNQLSQDFGSIDWRRIDAASDGTSAEYAALAAIGRS